MMILIDARDARNSVIMRPRMIDSGLAGKGAEIFPRFDSNKYERAYPIIHRGKREHRLTFACIDNILG